VETAALILLALSHGGHWFGGQTGTVTARCGADVDLPAAVFVWELGYGEVRIASGRQELPAGRGSVSFKLQTPQVRAVTDLTLVYRLELADGSGEIARSEATIRLYPTDLLAGAAERLSGVRIAVWDAPHGLPAVLAAAGVRHDRIDSTDALRSIRPQIVLVGPDQLPDRPLVQTPLLAYAEQGASVLILEQRKKMKLAGYPIRPRASPRALIWQEHPLGHDLRQWDLHAQTPSLFAIALPADEPVLEIASWPGEVASKQPAPVDALLVTKSVGKGRVVLCQLPLGDWSRDPRSQTFLATALDFLASPPGPTPPPSQRPKPSLAPPSDDRRLRIPSGVNP
jgi:hypothetical protein